MKFHEIAVCSIFVILICLWMFRDPQFMTGWARLLNHNMLVSFFISLIVIYSNANFFFFLVCRIPKDTTPAILMVILLFIVPSNPLGPYPSKSLLDWKFVQDKLAWNVILLRGGGFSMADAAEVNFKN